MLDSLRGFAKSWPGKVMGAFLLVGVAGFGINNVIMDLGSNTVSRVGSEEIDSREFLRAYQQRLNAFAQQYGSVPTTEQAMGLGIPGQVLQSLQAQAALDDLGNQLGLGVSEARLSEMLREDPNFAGTLGTFDPASFAQILAANGLTEAEYFRDQGDQAQQDQLLLSLFGDVQLPQQASVLLNHYQGDQRTIEYFALNETNLEPAPAPTEEELAAYLAEHQSEFRTVETRNVQMLRLSPADLAATKTIDDAAIAAEYERSQASLTQPERRTIQQVVLTQEQVAAFEAGKAAGTPFAQLVTEAGVTPTDLGTLAQADVTDAGLATAAFGLAAGDFVIIDGASGKRAVHVSAIEEGGVPTLEEAREQIAQNLALVEARNEIADIQDQVEELRAAFRPLTEIAERFGLELYKANVTAGGSELSVIPDLAPEDATRISQAIFKAEQGQLTAALPLAGSGNLYFDLTAIEPARDQTLEEVREEVTQAFETERTNDALIETAAAAAERVANGELIADVAASFNTFPQLSAPFGRFGSEDGTIDATVASAVFAGGDTHSGSAVSQSGEFLVFQVSGTMPAEGPLDEQQAEAQQAQLQSDILQDFVLAVLNDAQPRINQTALDQALALNTGL